MPLYSIQGPDGRTYEIEGPEGATREQVIAAIKSRMATQPAEEPKRLAGFGGSFMDAVTTLGLTDEAAAYAADPSDANRKKFLDAAKSKYDSAGGFGKGQDWEYFKELLGGSLGTMAAPVAAGLGASAVSTPLGGLGAFGATSTAQYTIQNLERQAQEQQASIDAGRAPTKTSLGKAALAATGQAGLDVAGTVAFGPLFKAFPFMRGLASAGAKSEAAIIEDAIKNGTLKTVGAGRRNVFFDNVCSVGFFSRARVARCLRHHLIHQRLVRIKLLDLTGSVVLILYAFQSREFFNAIRVLCFFRDGGRDFFQASFKFVNRRFSNNFTASASVWRGHYTFFF